MLIEMLQGIIQLFENCYLFGVVFDSEEENKFSYTDAHTDFGVLVSCTSHYDIKYNEIRLIFIIFI